MNVIDSDVILNILVLHQKILMRTFANKRNIDRLKVEYIFPMLSNLKHMKLRQRRVYKTSQMTR